MRRARVIAVHRAPDRPAIRVAPGDAVTLGERDGDWPDFVWTTLATGLGGWIPSVLFDRDRGEAIAQQDYDTRELHADVGDELVLHRELAQWWWAENDRGTQGWIPVRVLGAIEGQSIETAQAGFNPPACDTEQHRRLETRPTERDPP